MRVLSSLFVVLTSVSLAGLAACGNTEPESTAKEGATLSGGGSFPTFKPTLERRPSSDSDLFDRFALFGCKEAPTFRATIEELGLPLRVQWWGGTFMQGSEVRTTHARFNRGRVKVVAECGDRVSSPVYLCRENCVAPVMHLSARPGELTVTVDNCPGFGNIRVRHDWNGVTPFQSEWAAGADADDRVTSTHAIGRDVGDPGFICGDRIDVSVTCSPDGTQDGELRTRDSIPIPCPPGPDAGIPLPPDGPPLPPDAGQ
jgi:hypothetical protein